MLTARRAGHLAALLGTLLPGLCASADEPERPDVLLIVLDDANDWVGYLGGHPGALTPHIDRLAESAVAFTNAHCTAPLCQPSRTQLLYGRRARGYELEPDSAVPALTELFAAQGYRVIGGGKVFHEGNREHFAEYFEPPAAPEPPGSQKENLLESERDIGKFDWEPLAVDDAAMPDHQLVTWAIERLAAPPSEPLFLAVGLKKPHLPWYLPAAYFERHPLDAVTLPEGIEGDLDDLPPAAQRLAQDTSLDAQLGASERGREHAVQGYLAALSFADEQVGRLLAALAASPRGRSAIVVLLSDHGLHLGEKTHWRKQSLWEDGTRVPLLVRAPGIGAGVSAQPVDLSAIYPTLAELAQIPLPPGADGRSLAPLLADPEGAWPHVAVTVKEDGAALRDLRYRYIRYRDGGEELYDHEVDPHEWHNLARDPGEAGTLARLRARLEQEQAAW